jgi:tripartite-type tricarboxylate transporter receptor subunit TctC
MNQAIRTLCFLVLGLLGLPTVAQDTWPARPIRLVVNSSPGGATDYFARLMAQSLSEVLKQPVVVDNRPGASGNIGADIVAKASPDGYTVLVSSTPALIINPSLYANLPYNAERDFTPVAQGVVSPLVWVIHPSLPARTLADLVDVAKREPGQVAYGSAGSGSLPHLGVLLLAEESGVKFLHVPYKGLSNAAYVDLLSGQLKFVLSDIGTALPHIKSGKLLAIAVTEPVSQLPGVPTVAAAGFPNVKASGTFSVVAPAGTPASIIRRLSAEIVKAMKTPSIAEKLDQQVLIPVFDTPETFAATLKRERERWAGFIKRNSVLPD